MCSAGLRRILGCFSAPSSADPWDVGGRYPACTRLNLHHRVRRSSTMIPFRKSVLWRLSWPNLEHKLHRSFRHRSKVLNPLVSCSATLVLYTILVFWSSFCFDIYSLHFIFWSSEIKAESLKFMIWNVACIANTQYFCFVFQYENLNFLESRYIYLRCKMKR